MVNDTKDGDVALDDKIKTRAKALDKEIEDPDKDMGKEYEADKSKVVTD